LMEKFKLSEIQANAILDMRLYQLTGLEREKIDTEYEEIIKRISYLRDLLANADKIFALIKDDMANMLKLYADERRTQLIPDQDEMNMEDLIADRSYIITISHRGYIKRVPVEIYRAQRRGGKGVAGMGTRDEDYVQHLFVARTHDYILFFTETGRVYWEKVYEIPEAGRTSRGKAIVNMLHLRSEERIASMIRVREFSEDQHLVMASRKGVIKKSNLSQFKNPRRDGIIAINVDDDDGLIQVKMTTGEDDVVLATRNGKSIRFAESQLRDQGRATRGVRGVNLAKDDVVVMLAVVKQETTFLCCTEHGYGKRTDFDEYRGQRRGGKGIISIRTSDRNGKVVGAHAVREDDALMLITANGKMIRTQVSDLRVIGRTTQGVRLINLDDGDTLVSATTVAREDDVVEATQDGDIEGRAAPDIEASEDDAAEALQDGDGEAPDAE